MTGIKSRFVWNKLRFYFSFPLLAFYLAVGGVFLFTDQWADLLPKGRYITGIILTLFGILRFYIAYRRYANKQRKIKEKLLKENVTPQQ
jgi:hypothetical protein